MAEPVLRFSLLNGWTCPSSFLKLPNQTTTIFIILYKMLTMVSKLVPLMTSIFIVYPGTDYAKRSKYSSGSLPETNTYLSEEHPLSNLAKAEFKSKSDLL